MKLLILFIMILTGLFSEELNLEWKNNKLNKFNWEDAKSYCEELSSGGKSDWRVPNLIELSKHAENSPKVRLKNHLSNPNYYWSSLEYPHYKKAAWFVSFSESYKHFSIKTNKLYVKCVRKK